MAKIVSKLKLPTFVLEVLSLISKHEIIFDEIYFKTNKFHQKLFAQTMVALDLKSDLALENLKSFLQIFCLGSHFWRDKVSAVQSKKGSVCRNLQKKVHI